MHTSPFRPGPSYSNAATVELRPQSNDALELLHHAVDAARRIWREGYSYSKAGIILTGLVPVERVQPSLLDAADRVRGARLMAAMDAINDRMGRGTLVPASVGFRHGQAWAMQQGSRSPDYTTRIQDVPVVYA